MKTQLAIAILLIAAMAHAQTVPAPDIQPAPPAETEAGWSFSATVYTYFIPDSHEYIQPTIIADRDWLHLEARYNYEDQNTGSVWIGYNFSGGEKLAWEITPMLGGVFGDTTGVAPGYKGSLSWWRFELYSEGEYVIDTGDTSASYFYNWSEFTFSPFDHFRFGLATQRTHAYQSDRDLQRGLMIGYTYKHLDFSAYVFNPDEGTPIVAIALRVDF